MAEEWITQPEAAELLGVQRSAIPKMIRRGLLTPRDRRPSLRRSEVVALAAARAAEAAERERLRIARARRAQGLPPDDEHTWLREAEAAAVLGCTPAALHERATRGQVPYVVHSRVRWFRLDLLELIVRARAADPTR